MTKKSRPAKAKRLLLTDRSLNDIAAIEQYSIEQWGKKTASKYLAQIEAALTRIQIEPNLFWQEEDFHPALQFYSVNQHVLVFDTQTTAIVLLTLFHGSRDIFTHLAELEPTLAKEVEMLHRKL